MQSRPYKLIQVSASDGVAKIVMNRPERRNALNPPMINELSWAFDDALGAEDVKSIVLTGAGNAFCAGADFSQLGPSDDELPHKGDFKDLLLTLWRTTKPVIARVNGPALGGGLGLVAASTFAVASTDAKLGTPEVNVGLFPFMIMAVLERVMPRRKLVEMMLFGERLSAEQAAACGLVNQAVPLGEIDAAVKAYTDMIGSKSPLTLKLGLEALSASEELTLDEKLPFLHERLFAALGTDDAREGMRAFLEKRPPKWTGR